MLREPSVLPKKQQNHAVRLITRFTTLWRSEIHINLKIDAGVAFVSTVKYFICNKGNEGSMLVSAHASMVYAVSGIKSKKKSYWLYCQPNLTKTNPTYPNLTKTNLNPPNSFKLRSRCTTKNTTQSRSSITNVFHNVVEKRNPYQSKNRRRRRFRVRRTIYIYQVQWRQYADKCACLYAKCSLNNKLENKTNLTDCTSNLT
jgi:hypothetical protein